jgi:uncharacterized membrane protein
MMKKMFKISAVLIAITAAISGYMFLNPVPESFMPHWIFPLIAFICLLILIGAERGPKPKQRERGFGVILYGVPLLAIAFQLHYLAAAADIAVMKSELVPILGLHIFLAAVGNYVTTSKSLLSGLPTPWNMRSELSWRKSHRFAGFGLVFVAFISAIATVIEGRYNHNVLGSLMLALGVIFVIYSWWVWRTDPARGPLHGRR